MGISVQSIPAIADLQPLERRELARWVRSWLPRGHTASRHELVTQLDDSPWAGRVTPERLVELGWFRGEPLVLSADTYERREAAGAVDGKRMTVTEAHKKAREVANRLDAMRGQKGGVRVLRVVLYGSAVRDAENGDETIGDLDLALELDIYDKSLAKQLAALPAERRWREAIDRSGLSEALTGGDDRVTLAGSVLRVVSMFDNQLNGRDLDPFGRLPAAVIIWERQNHTASSNRACSDIEALPALLHVVLASLDRRTQDTHQRAQKLIRRL